MAACNVTSCKVKTACWLGRKMYTRKQKRLFLCERAEEARMRESNVTMYSIII